MLRITFVPHSILHTQPPLQPPLSRQQNHKDSARKSPPTKSKSPARTAPRPASAVVFVPHTTAPSPPSRLRSNASRAVLVVAYASSSHSTPPTSSLRSFLAAWTPPAGSLDPPALQRQEQLSFRFYQNKTLFCFVKSTYKSKPPSYFFSR